jgi:hypothetical protein
LLLFYKRLLDCAMCWLSFHNSKERIHTISLLFLRSLMLLYLLFCVFGSMNGKLSAF